MTEETKLLTNRVCDRCKARSLPIFPAYSKYLPSGWSHLTYVVPALEHGKLPGALEDNKEFDFCFNCSQEILNDTRV